MGKIDLHIHTTASDGTLSPKEVVDLAIETGLSAIAITDHDTVAGVEEAIEYAKDKPIKVIPGVEISTNLGRQEVHMLGYNIDYKSPIILKTLEILALIRDIRTERMVKLLQADNVDISMEQLKEMFPNAKSLNRANMAIYLVEKGIAQDKYEAFEKYLDGDTKYYVKKNRITAEDAVNVILDSYGIPVMAHPVLYPLDVAAYTKLFKRAKEIGVQGVEAIYSNNRPGDREFFSNLAEQNGLFITAGSDFHGAVKPLIQLGKGFIDDSHEKFEANESILENLKLS